MLSYAMNHLGVTLNSLPIWALLADKSGPSDPLPLVTICSDIELELPND